MRSAILRPMWKVMMHAGKLQFYLPWHLVHVKYRDIYTEGITKITAEDMKYAKEMGMTIKSWQTARGTGNVFAMVCPVMLGKDSPLYSVNGVFNAVFVHGNVLGTLCFTVAVQANCLQPALWQEIW